MLLKRYIPIGIVAFFGALTLSAWFIDNETIETFANDDATQFFDIIAAFAVFLGALNLLKLQFIKVLKQQSGWQYSAVAIASFFFAFIIGFFIRGAYFVGEEVYFSQGAAEEAILALGSSEQIVPVDWGAHVQTDGSLFQWMFKYIFSPLSATMFALLAFFVASASFRAFRARNLEASLLLVAGIIIMLGRVPVGSLISSWVIIVYYCFFSWFWSQCIYQESQYGSWVGIRKLWFNYRIRIYYGLASRSASYFLFTCTSGMDLFGS